MKISKLLIILALVMIAGEVYPQKMNNLKIGDAVPDISFEMLNSKSARLSLSDLKGKYVILDFWATWCTSCIKKFPELDSIQKEFKDNLQIVLINSTDTKDTRKRVEQFFTKYRMVSQEALSLPSAINDTIAAQYFPHLSIPHYVWINNKGIVMAITSANEFTRQNIVKFVAGETLDLRQKSDAPNIENTRYFSRDIGAIKSKTMFTGYLDGVSDMKSGSGYGGEISRFCLINTSIWMMYRIAFNNYFSANRVIVEGINREELVKPRQSKGWEYEHTFCYERIASPRSRTEMLKLFRNDLIDFFGITATVVNKQVKCLVIKQKGKIVIPTAAYAGFDGKLIETKDFKTVGHLTDSLDDRLEIPVLDDTGAAPLTLSGEIRNLKHLQSELNKRGFDFKEEMREVAFFLLKKTDH